MPKYFKKRKGKRKDKDMNSLMNLFNKKKSKNKKNKTKNNDSSKHKKIKISNNNNNKKINKLIKTTKNRKLKKKLISNKELNNLPNTLLVPKCVNCYNKVLVVKRGDECYIDYASVSCDICGREDIHSNVWHCNKCNNFDMCKSCGYLIPRNRKNEIFRPGPANDDLGLILSNKTRNRNKTNDGFTIYKVDEIKKTLKIGLGGGTNLCPFDCKCCY